MPSGTIASRTASRKHLAGAAALVCALLSLTLYTVTLVPEVGWGDAAEFALQAAKLGVTHPPGSPMHTFLGYLFCQVTYDPAFGTNLLSAVCTAVSVAVLTLICFELTRNWYAGLAAALIFAVLPRVWEMAVITEVYNVNTCLFALALFLVILAQRRPSMLLLCASAIVTGLSIGTYLANLLLLPGFVWLATRHGRNKVLPAGLFVSLAAVTGVALLSWSHFRVADCVPLGTLYLPDTLANFVSYLMGSQYGTTMVHSPGFYLDRVVEHALVFGGSFAWLGAFLGLWGLVTQWKRDRRMCIGLGLMFLANMAFFTGYIPFDYYTMVNPCYFVFAVWIAYCVDLRATDRRLARPAVISKILPMAVVAILLCQQFTTRAARACQTPVTDFAMSSFGAMPLDAAVIADWPRFAALVYFQEIHGFRRDLTLIERSTQPRNYPFGIVLDWRSYLYRATADRTVFVDEPDAYALPCYKVHRTDPNWCAFERQPAVRAADRDKMSRMDFPP